MSEQTYLLMADTEMEVFQAASRIYSAMIQSNQVTDENKKEVMKNAIQQAIELADMTDDMVTSPDENADRKDGRRTYGLRAGQP